MTRFLFSLFFLFRLITLCRLHLSTFLRRRMWEDAFTGVTSSLCGRMSTNTKVPEHQLTVDGMSRRVNGSVTKRRTSVTSVTNECEENHHLLSCCCESKLYNSKSVESGVVLPFSKSVCWSVRMWAALNKFFSNFDGEEVFQYVVHVVSVIDMTCVCGEKNKKNYTCL